MKKYLILIPFHNPWKWHTDYTNQTATILSRSHIVVCFLWGDAVSLWELIQGRKTYKPIVREKTLWKVQPLFLVPGKRFFTIQLINIFVNTIFVHILCTSIAVWYSRTRLFWFFGYYDPVFLLLPPFFRRWKTVYDCVDIATHPDLNVAFNIRTSETRLISDAWIVVTDSHTLSKRMKKLRPDVLTVPLGFRLDMFRRRARPYPLPLTNKRPIIGYIGSIDYRLDFRLLCSLVTNHPNWQFVLVGPIFYDHLSVEKRRAMVYLLSLPNVLYDIVQADAIPNILVQFSVAIIPYDMNVPLSRFSFPMKIMEYFYAQKPVISAPIDELFHFSSLIRFARTITEWEQQIHTALAHPMTRAQRQTARAIARNNSWEQKIAAIEKFMSAVSK